MAFSTRLYVPVYALTLLLSAFLLFLIQPMIGKMILPMLGGSPAVWNTAMMFFQTLLLAGYAYAHATARFLNIRLQAALHVALLILFIFVLPIAVPEGWIPPATENPSIWQLGLMAVMAGGPFFVLSGSAPMLQHWFAHGSHKDAQNPYFLYAASNFGSMSALIAYPFFIEPALQVGEQSMLWAQGYGVLILLTVLAAAVVGRQKTSVPAADSASADAPDWRKKGMWVLLAFVPSSLMLGVTTYITTDLASVPLLWILPLALYVSTFIIAFSRKPLIGTEKTYYFQGLLFIMLLSFLAVMADLSKLVMIAAHLLLFFFTALMCHHELAATRPHPRHLTQFYLLLSLGGALGGVFNALIAPVIFLVPFEYGLVLAVGCFLRETTVPEKSLAAAWGRFKSGLKDKDKDFLNSSGLTFVIVIFFAAVASLFLVNFGSLRIILLFVFLTVLTIVMEKRWVFGMCAAIILALHPPGFYWGSKLADSILHRDRNFFGMIRVADAERQGVRVLLHGTTIHGTQAIAAQHKLLRLSYYAENSGITEAFAMAEKDGPQTIAVLGLGIGVAACFTHEGRKFEFFEIDPAVVEVAENKQFFTYLSDCGSPYEIVLGDARLRMTEQPGGKYGIIVMDAFSSDSIPIHLITREALELYKHKIEQGGMIVVNISNRYMDLRPVLANAAAALGLSAYNKYSDGGHIEDLPYHQADFVVLTENPAYIEQMEKADWRKLEPYDDFRMWTDQYSNIVSVLKFFRLPEAKTEIVE